MHTNMSKLCFSFLAVNIKMARHEKVSANPVKGKKPSVMTRKGKRMLRRIVMGYNDCLVMV